MLLVIPEEEQQPLHITCTEHELFTQKPLDYHHRLNYVRQFVIKASVRRRSLEKGYLNIHLGLHYSVKMLTVQL